MNPPSKTVTESKWTLGDWVGMLLFLVPLAIALTAGAYLLWGFALHQGAQWDAEERERSREERAEMFRKRTPPMPDLEPRFFPTPGWKKGPMPAGTWRWGGVVLKGQNGQGFYFADFRGDHVKLIHDGRIVKPEEIALYNNSLAPPSME